MTHRRNLLFPLDSYFYNFPYNYYFVRLLTFKSRIIFWRFPISFSADRIWITEGKNIRNYLKVHFVLKTFVLLGCEFMLVCVHSLKFKCSYYKRKGKPNRLHIPDVTYDPYWHKCQVNLTFTHLFVSFGLQHINWEREVPWVLCSADCSDSLSRYFAVVVKWTNLSAKPRKQNVSSFESVSKHLWLRFNNFENKLANGA